MAMSTYYSCKGKACGSVGAVYGGCKALAVEGYQGASEGFWEYGKKGWEGGIYCGEMFCRKFCEVLGGLAGIGLAGYLIPAEWKSYKVFTAVETTIAEMGREFGKKAGEYAGHYGGGIFGALGGLIGAAVGAVCGVYRGVRAIPEGVKNGWQRGIEYAKIKTN